MQPTLEEVATRAGLSRAAASRVLRGESNVSESARAAVLDAAKEISYRASCAARWLVTGHSDSVAFLVDETEERMFTDPFFLGMLRSAQVAIAAAGLQLVFTVTSGPDDYRRLVAYAAGGHVDGVFLMSLHGCRQLPQQLEALGVPTVLSGRPLTGRRTIYYVDAQRRRWAAGHRRPDRRRWQGGGNRHRAAGHVRRSGPTRRPSHGHRGGPPIPRWSSMANSPGERLHRDPAAPARSPRRRR